MSTYNKENFLNHLNLLTPNGFSMNSSGRYIKNEQNKIISIGFAYNESFPFDVQFGGCSVGVCFNNVEQIYHTVCQQTNYNPSHIVTADTFVRGFRESIIGQANYENVLLTTKVEDDVSFAQIRPYLEQMLQACLSFLNQYKTLEDFYNYGESLSGRDRARFYKNPPPRLLIVKKLLNIPYDSLATQYFNRFNQINNIDKANFIQALKNHLDSL